MALNRLKIRVLTYLGFLKKIKEKQTNSEFKSNLITKS